MIAIMLFFAVKAAELLQSPIIAVMLASCWSLADGSCSGPVSSSAASCSPSLASNLVAGTGSEGWLPAILKWSIIALSVAMGLRFMGLANEIVIIAFASIIGSAAVACALAFGLGGARPRTSCSSAGRMPTSRRHRRAAHACRPRPTIRSHHWCDLPPLRRDRLVGRQGQEAQGDSRRRLRSRRRRSLPGGAGQAMVAHRGSGVAAGNS
jgi:hypothetical protein